MATRVFDLVVEDEASKVTPTALAFATSGARVQRTLRRLTAVVGLPHHTARRECAGDSERAGDPSRRRTSIYVLESARPTPVAGAVGSGKSSGRCGIWSGGAGMRRVRLFCAVLAVLGVSAWGVPAAYAPPVTVSGCTAATTPGAGINTFPATPAWPGSPSALMVSCVLDSRSGSSTVTPSYTVHDFANQLWHNGAARTIQATAAPIPAGSTSFTAMDCTAINGAAGSGVPTDWSDRTITAVGNLSLLPPYTFVTSISPTCVVTLNKTFGPIPGSTTFRIDNSRARAVNDGGTDGTSSTVISGTANFQNGDNGLSLTGANIDADGTTLGGPFTSTTATYSPFPAPLLSPQILTFGATMEVTTTRTVNDATFSGHQQDHLAGGGFREQ
jgi:hypothetical protein